MNGWSVNVQKHVDTEYRSIIGKSSKKIFSEESHVREKQSDKVNASSKIAQVRKHFKMSNIYLEVKLK